MIHYIELKFLVFMFNLIRLFYFLFRFFNSISFLGLLNKIKIFLISNLKVYIIRNKKNAFFLVQ